VTQSLLGEAPAPPEAPAAQAQTAALRVLLADDNPVNQALVRGFLERRGHSVAVARTGREALAAVEGGTIDVVLMDIEMPEMGGLEAAALLRRREQEAGRARLPVVALTAHAMKGDRERCLAAGMDDYLTKPLRSADLDRVLARLAGGPAPAAGTAAAGSSRPLDRAVLLARVEGDEALLDELVRLFVGDVPARLGEVAVALAAGDAPALRTAAHAVKSAVSNFVTGTGGGPAPAAVVAARRLEELAAAGDLSAAAAASRALEEAVARLRDELLSLAPAAA
jgi:CheY-like chemotaxis protein